MLSKDDIKRLIEVFATKADLARVRDEMVTKDEFVEATDGVMNKLDAVYGELKDFRQEQTVHVAQNEKIRDDISGLKARVRVLR